MASSVGGFTAPSLVAHYCLRTPEEVGASSDHREFTWVALLSPALGFIIFVANKLVGEPEEKIDTTTNDEEEICQENADIIIQESIDETTPLNIDRRRSDGDSPMKSLDMRKQLRRKSLVETSFRGSCNIIPENDDIFKRNV